MQGMGGFNILVMRVVLGTVFAVVIIRFFHGRINIFYVAALAVFLVGMSYVTEYFRNRKKNQNG